MKKRALFTLVVAGLSWSIAATCLATTVTRVHLFGAENLDCTGEMDPDCAAEVLAGGYTAWDSSFEPPAFTSITSMMLDVYVVGIYESGNIDPLQGQIRNHFAIDGVAYAPIAPPLDNLDGRNHRSFVLPILAPGEHRFSVWAFEPAEDAVWPSRFEGWGGVDFATLTVEGESQAEPTEEFPAVPEPASLVLLGTGLLGAARVQRRFHR